MENISADQNTTENSVGNADTPKVGLSESLSRKYPYLTAFIGCIAMYVLAGIAATIIFGLPGYLLSDFINSDVYFTRANWFIAILRLVLSFYGFKYVINKNLLPYIGK